jgi:hypothetical protein
VGTNFEIAMLLQSPARRPSIVLRPTYEESVWADVGDAMNLGRDDRPSSLYCIPVQVRRWNGKPAVVLANGFLMELTGRIDGVGEGRRCLCGRGLGPNHKDGLDRFEAGSTCSLPTGK